MTTQTCALNGTVHFAKLSAAGINKDRSRCVALQTLAFEPNNKK